MAVTNVRSKWSSGELVFYDKDTGTSIMTIKDGADGIEMNRQIRDGNVKSQTKSANYTMTAADSGYETIIDTDAKTITLPATAAGLTYTFVNGGADAAVAVTISPNASDRIMGAGLTAADNKDLINTKTTARKGDRVTIVGDGADGWYVQSMVGTWAREA